jgi:hypothetical protein
MNFIIRSLIQLGILKKDLDYHLLRALMVIICLFFGYRKWFDYEPQALIPISVTVPSSSGCIASSAFAEQPTFLASRNGYSVHCCSPDSGTKSWVFSGLSAYVSL